MRLFDRRVGPIRCQVVATSVVDGDVHPLRVDPLTLVQRQIAATGARWTMLNQVHGTDVVDVDALPVGDAVDAATGESLVTRDSVVAATGDALLSGDAVVVATGDAARSAEPGRRLAIWSADCAPLVLFGRDGAVVVAHAGWRGLADGIVEAAWRRLDQPVAAAVLGPVIHSCCYAFGADDLESVASGLGVSPDAIAGRTLDGRLALDIPAAVRCALTSHGVDVDVIGPCTGCDPAWFSHRVRRDVERQATVAWIERIGSDG